MTEQREIWIGTWASSPTDSAPQWLPESATLLKGTIRHRLRVSRGSRRLRLRLSNEYGAAPLEISSITIGRADKGLCASPGSLIQATFKGQKHVTIPATKAYLTDPIDIAVGSLEDVIVSLYVPQGTVVAPWPVPGIEYSGVAENTDATDSEFFSAKGDVDIRPIVSAIHALSGDPAPVVAAIGDSITDGQVDPETGDRGWPGALSRRLAKRNVSVVNAGIGGNRLLEGIIGLQKSALERLDQDVFTLPGLTHIIVAEGINDIGMSAPGQETLWGNPPLVRPEELIAGYLEIIRRGRDRGIKVFGATITPFEGADYYSEEKERVRQAANDWIRESRAFDGVFDFDAVLRDPLNATKLRAEYDCGDFLHPNSLGSRAMADSIDLDFVQVM